MSCNVIGKSRASRQGIVWLLVVAFVASALLGLPGAAAAKITEPQDEDRQIALVVTALMRKEHLTRRPLDEEVAQRTIKTMLRNLDSWKVYFTQADADEFMAARDELLQQVRQGNVELGWRIFSRFLERLDERMPLIQKYIAADHDYTIEEEITTEPDDMRFARTPAESEEAWRKRIKYELLVLTESDKLPIEEARGKLTRRYNSFAKRMHQFDNNELRELYLTAITSSYDPHSSYMAPDAQENFGISMSLGLEGIGAQLEFDDGYTLINKVIPGGPADKDGRLKPKDKIVGVGQGESGEILDVVEMKLTDVVKLVRGQSGTVVRLQVVPAGTTEKKVYALTRAQIELNDATGKVFEEERDGHTFRLGVINLPSFYMDMDGARNNTPMYKSTTRDVQRILDEFRAQKVDALVLDLRHNTGGSLTEAINLTGLFIDSGPVVLIKDRDGRRHPYNDTTPGMAWDGPLVVLTSKFSASASEIFAGAIQDYGRGLVVGDRATHGKGTVQSLLDLGRQLFAVPNHPQMGALKITLQQFYRPSGASTQNRGVNADVVLPSVTDELKISESDLDYAVAFDQVEAEPHKAYGLVNRQLIDRLRAASEQRCQQSQDFQRVQRNIERLREQLAKKTISLNIENYRASRNEADLQKTEEEELEQLGDSGKIKRDYYMIEALQVTLDYLAELNKLASRR